MNKNNVFPNNLFNPKVSKYILIFIILLALFRSELFKSNNKFFFFEFNQDKLKYCQNYGILVYDYNYNGKIDKIRANIGDYI